MFVKEFIPGEGCSCFAALSDSFWECVSFLLVEGVNFIHVKSIQAVIIDE